MEESGRLSSVTQRALRRELKKMGVKEEKLPAQLRDSIVKKGKKGPLGQMVVRQISGVVENACSKTARMFEDNVGGKEDIAEKLLMVRESLNKDQQVLLSLLLEPTSKKQFPRLLAESGAELTGVMTAYTRGALLLGQTQAIIEAARNLPRVAKDLAAHALDGTGVCDVCAGSGKVAPRKGGLEETKACPMCRGEGTKITTSKHKEFAVEKILEIGKMVEKRGPMVQVNQQVGVKVNGGGGSTMETFALMADEILHGRGKSPDVVEAEVVDATS